MPAYPFAAASLTPGTAMPGSSGRLIPAVELDLRCELPDPRLPEVKLLTPARYTDGLGVFTEVLNTIKLRQLGVEFECVEDSLSRWPDAGTISGLHCQIPPYARALLLRVARGSVFAVAVDVRNGSRNFGRAVAVTIGAQSGRQMLIPAGFAHGLCTLEADTEVQFRADNLQSLTHERGFAWDDPALAIPWPVSPAAARLTDDDRNLPRLNEAPRYFAAR